ncbi:hypothetical protein RF11_11278 [Thelohanellus kitauei]|uniref:Uncharacterized protein n=1 Tax=Thelohanellus kitauei TaxID=669202 RepID=A0A0C2I7K8_THEKT|nr:hypothetical protein RF11_11278 [Thelohanellus kitauei]
MSEKIPKSNARHRFYNKEWEKMYPITEVPSDRHAFHCVPCARTISCADKGLRNVRRHCETSMHRKTITDQMFGTNIPRLSVINSPGLALNKSTPAASSRILNTTPLSTINNTTGSPAAESTPKVCVSENLPKLAKTPIPQNKEKKFNINNLEDNLNGMELLEKYKFAYGLARKVEVDFTLANGPGNDRVRHRIKDELNFLHIALKHLQNAIE